MALQILQHPFLKTTAAVVAALVLGYALSLQSVTAGNVATGRVISETRLAPIQTAEYFPARFTLQPDANESQEPIPTF